MKINLWKQYFSLKYNCGKLLINNRLNLNIIKKINSCVKINSNSIKCYTTTLNSNSNKNYIWGIDKDSDISKFESVSSKIIEDLCIFYSSLEKRRVIPEVKPNFLKDKLINKKAPSKGEKMEDILKELNNNILKYMTLWNHPGFYNWYPSMTSFPAMLSNLIIYSNEYSSINYNSNPVIYELESKVINWLVDILNLPENFRSKKSGGVIHFAAGECSVIAALAAKTHKKLELIEQYKANNYKNNILLNSSLHSNLNLDNNNNDRYSTKQVQSNNGILSNNKPNQLVEDEKKFVFYYSSIAHYSVKKGINIAGYEGRIIPSVWSDEYSNFTTDTDYLEKQIIKDIEDGFIPTYICATLGTTSTCALDDCEKIGRLSKKYKIWLHVDAAYIGSSFMLEDYKDVVNSIKNANSLVINGNKLMPVSENSGYFFTSDYYSVMKTFNENAIDINSESIYNKVQNLNSDTNYLSKNFEYENFIDSKQKKTAKKEYNNYEIMSSRQNKALRLYTVFSVFGKFGLKNIVSKLFNAAKIFETKLENSGYFDIVCKTKFALVCFRLKNKTIKENMQFIEHINKEPKISIGPYVIPDVDEDKSYISRISVNYIFITDAQAEKDCDYLIEEFKKCFKIN